MSNFRPLHDRVVLRRLTAEEKTAGGIIIPGTAQEKPTEGEVVAVGPGARNEQGQIVPLEVKAGDKVLFGKWSGTGPAHRARETGAPPGRSRQGRSVPAAPADRTTPPAR
jgi:chaperonin GroES